LACKKGIVFATEQKKNDMKILAFTLFFLFSYSLFAQTEESLFKMRKHDKYGFANKKMEIIIPCVYDDVFHFSEGLAGVESDGYWGFINIQGDTIVPLIYDAVVSFSNGLAPVCQNKLWGYINQKGETVIPIQFQNAWEFNENGRAMVQKGKDIIFIDRKGNTLP